VSCVGVALPPPALSAVGIWPDMNPACVSVVGCCYRFLWKVTGDGDKVRVFKWTGKNDYVALCEPESISFGGGCVLALSPTPSCFGV
jgi:hypothetical protein